MSQNDTLHHAQEFLGRIFPRLSRLRSLGVLLWQESSFRPLSNFHARACW